MYSSETIIKFLISPLLINILQLSNINCSNKKNYLKEEGNFHWNITKIHINLQKQYTIANSLSLSLYIYIYIYIWERERALQFNDKAMVKATQNQS